ncbi:MULTISPECIES: AAA family ATPase [unclassified Dysgonomonas]|uniref:AAA family ATPase n=1 Tax=unclassified Dysgonomonas TaxID=2630389 RepID=UPI0013ED9751|nr:MULTISPECIES: AAA family ATPase [unclassified Dysgonomonas]
MSVQKQHLVIKNIGPIRDVDIHLTKINVIIGPQSSGKSTIDKIACYCSWVEKRVCRLQSFDFFLEDGAFAKELVRFHKLDGYLREDSRIEYESDFIKIAYLHSTGKPTMEWGVKRYEFKRPKISYIPSERNMVAAISNWFEVKFDDNNILSFMADWDNARKIYSKESPIEILNLDAKYYYDASSKSDWVIVGNCVSSIEKENREEIILELTNTSSGLQSLIPLYVLIDFCINGIYKYEKSSVETLSEDDKLNLELLKYKLNVNTAEEILSTINHIRKALENEDVNDESVKKILEYSSLKNNFISNNFTKIYLEEPEANLFPSTQRDLIYSLLQTIKKREADSIMITTHSPYILYALNNCMKGYSVKDKVPKEEIGNFKSYNAWTDPKDISVWEIDYNNGTLKSIKNEERGTIGAHYFNRVMKETMDEYYDLLNY